MDPAILEPVDLFQGLDADQLVAVSSIAIERAYEESQPIFQEGDPGDRIYVVAWGEVRISKRIPGIGEEALAILEAGAAFGEMMLVEEGVSRSADATAHTACIVGVFGKDPLELLLASRRDIAPIVYRNLARMLAGRLRETNEKIKAFFAMSSRW